MDINCTHSCMYQREGKCNLRELPVATQTTYNHSDTDCPYYSEYARPVV